MAVLKLSLGHCPDGSLITLLDSIEICWGRIGFSNGNKVCVLTYH